MRVFNFFFMIAIFLCSTATQAETMLQTLQGEDIALSSLKGKWVYVNYWASWCGPCLDEIAELNRFYESNKSHHVEVFAVNYDSMPLSKQKRLIKKFDIRYPSLKYSATKALQLGNIEVVPVTFVLNPEGELSEILYGGQTMTSLMEAMSSPLRHATSRQLVSTHAKEPQ